MTAFRFHKSSYSATSSECVEVARNIPRTVGVRDSKRPDGPVIVLGPAAWDAFQDELVRSD
ncbi:DUF397 domain-containing protein [Streptomyces sp. CB01580]|uniref:DUF397 domain-containing protein n=1 Tax=Streptomyces sp. CB01580 TaxID=1703933 RepID=UPI0009388DAA|nr:DUF397 domain-containing protein [Streptomyces sp. CB01580]OKJ26726.1 hypothetical protein AMK22_30540 [Streptomyces sp. CB01580]